MESTPAVACRRATIEEILPLRHGVLRAGLPLESAPFAGDDDPRTHHFGAFAGEMNVCCASFMISAWGGEPAWQLRGMATRDGWRGRGVGAALLRFAVPVLRVEESIGVMWCNARVEAAGFYVKQGWTVVSETFEIAGVGPHCRMVKRL